MPLYLKHLSVDVLALQSSFRSSEKSSDFLNLHKWLMADAPTSGWRNTALPPDIAFLYF